MASEGGSLSNLVTLGWDTEPYKCIFPIFCDFYRLLEGKTLESLFL